MSEGWRTGFLKKFASSPVHRTRAAEHPVRSFFPLGGFFPLQSSVLDSVAASLQAKPMQVALAWLLQRSPNILLIPGTSSVAHLRENLGAASMELPADAIAQLNRIAKGSSPSVASHASDYFQPEERPTLKSRPKLQTRGPLQFGRLSFFNNAS